MKTQSAFSYEVWKSRCQMLQRHGLLQMLRGLVSDFLPFRERARDEWNRSKTRKCVICGPELLWCEGTDSDGDAKWHISCPACFTVYAED